MSNTIKLDLALQLASFTLSRLAPHNFSSRTPLFATLLGLEANLLVHPQWLIGHYFRNVLEGVQYAMLPGRLIAGPMPQQSF